MSFTAKDVAELRAKTNAGMMDCKKALSECDGDFEKAMVQEAKKSRLFRGRDRQLHLSNPEKTVAYQRGGRIFAFNFHPTDSYTAFFLPVPEAGEYEVVMSTDDYCFGGQGRIYHQSYTASVQENGATGFRLYLPSRTAVVLKKIKR